MPSAAGGTNSVASRRIALELRQFNDPTLVAISNIERRIVQLIGDEKAAHQIGVHATRDQNEHYHATLCYCNLKNEQPNQKTSPKYLKLSQSTRLNLAEALVKKLLTIQ